MRLYQVTVITATDLSTKLTVDVRHNLPCPAQVGYVVPADEAWFASKYARLGEYRMNCIAVIGTETICLTD